MAKKYSDYAKDYDPNYQKEMSPAFRAALNKATFEARKNIIKRGLIQFRADKQLIEALLDCSELNHVPVGVFCRDIIWSYLQNKPGFITKENVRKGKKSKAYDSPDSLTGKVSEDSEIEDLIESSIENLNTLKKRLRK